MPAKPGATPRPLWQRALFWPIGALVFLCTWGLGSGALVTGLVLWRNWHALAARGVDATGRVERCERKSAGGIKSRGGMGYSSCTYTYRPVPDGPVYQGDFQSGTHWEAGHAIPIRYLPYDHSVSATAQDVEHRKLVPGAMVALGVGLLAWFGRSGWKERRRAKLTHDPPGA